MPTRVTAENRGHTNMEPGATPDTPELNGSNVLNDYGYNVTHQRRDLGGTDSKPRADYEVEGLGQVDEYLSKTKHSKRRGFNRNTQ